MNIASRIAVRFDGVFHGGFSKLLKKQIEFKAASALAAAYESIHLARVLGSTPISQAGCLAGKNS